MVAHEYNLGMHFPRVRKKSWSYRVLATGLAVIGAMVGFFGG
jgi:hypothetical protein